MVNYKHRLFASKEEQIVNTRQRPTQFGPGSSSIPILHQRRYRTWSKSSTRTASRRCLQYAK
ncbi:hypothetical protein BJX63DRAFT_394268 [Aspergillus granulosus]|uniref:Uncharacterized protein n=1 Tax=Aspergillus granulosus TaxID=176169 RepID=A0ABR4HD32_9EURO